MNRDLSGLKSQIGYNEEHLEEEIAFGEKIIGVFVVVQIRKGGFIYSFSFVKKPDEEYKLEKVGKRKDEFMLAQTSDPVDCDLVGEIFTKDDILEFVDNPEFVKAGVGYAFINRTGGVGGKDMDWFWPDEE